MKFFLDENFPKSATGMLEHLGHVVFDLGCAEGSRDADIFDEAQKCGAIFLTTDRDFFHTIPHLFPHHEGVIVIALRQPNRAAILENRRGSWGDSSPQISPAERSNSGIELGLPSQRWNRALDA